MAPGTLSIELPAFRVLKAHGSWAVGDIRFGETLCMTQGIRTGMVERVPEHDYPVSLSVRDAENPDGHVFVIPASPVARARRKKEMADGEATI
jgi:hypothetical protein